MKSSRLILLAFLWLVLIPLTLPGQGKVYLVIGSDTAVWNVPGGVDVTQYHGHFSSDLYILPQNNAYHVMDPAFRNRFIDSYGQPLKLAWWMLVGSIYLQADNNDVPIRNLMPLYLIHKYHGAAMQQFGDELSLHYHTFFWSDYNHDGKFYWNQSLTFHECRADFDFAFAESLIEEGVFPVSFRSGWHFMDNEWQAYLNELFPFSMHNNSPNVHADSVEPFDNVYDWSKAPLTWIPYHPATTNYQVPGDGVGWDLRSIKMPSVSQSTMNQMFAQAAGGTDQVASIWAHLPEIDYLTNIARIDLLAHTASSNYPTVQFRYCTAVEAMQRWLGRFNEAPPQLDVSEETVDDVLTLTISCTVPIFQPQPFVAIKDICDQYRLVSSVSNGPNQWKTRIPVPRRSLAKIGIALTDAIGNLATRVIRYVPDDLYLDNLDPQYHELAGNWVSTTNAAWGIDARIASLSSGDIAEAEWSLPITSSGLYEISVQVPSVTNAATNLLFTAWTGTTNSLSILIPDPLPGKQWVALGVAFLDQSLSNVLRLSVSSSNQPGSFAVADVIKVSPLLPSQLIENLNIDASDTTANITWTTPVPSPSYVEFGTDLRYGQFSTTNLTLVTNHVVTLAGLATNLIYYVQIPSVPGSPNCPAQSSFLTTNYAATSLIFDVTNSWKFSTNRLDGTNWQSVAFDDTAWPSGRGLLWVETRGSNYNPAVQPKGTQMPTNTATKLPFITYYLRTHFFLATDPPPLAVTFSNYLDDGAVFYLNGAEIHRQNMAAPPTVISNSTLAIASSCGGDATCPVLFTITGDVLTNLVNGDNLLAVEVHNFSAGSTDITFGSALSYTHPYSPIPSLSVIRSGDNVGLFWNGSGFHIRQSPELGPAAVWIDAPGANATSPYWLNPSVLSGTQFYRLSN